MTESMPQFEEPVNEQVVFVTLLMRATPKVFVTPVIIGLNVAVYLVMGVAGAGWMDPSPDTLIKWGGDFWPYTTSGEWWRLLTSTFLHGGLIHLAMNMYALLAAGKLVERLFGNVSFTLMYLFAGLTGGLASLMFVHNRVSVGASGAIFGVYGALIAYLLAQRSSFPRGMVGGILRSAVIFVGYNVLYGATSSGIDNSAHVGGLIGGFVMGFVLARPLHAEARKAQTVPRLAVGLLGGLVVIGGWGLAMPKADPGERQFDAMLNVVAALEAPIPKRYNALRYEWDSNKIDGKQFAAALEAEALPAWDRIIAAVDAVHLKESSSKQRAYQFLHGYYILRRETYRVAAEGARTGNQALMMRSSMLLKKGDEMVEEYKNSAPK